MKLKNIWKLFPVFLIIGIIIFFERKGNIERKEFYTSDINSYIVKKKNNWSGGRSYDYITAKNIIITLMNSDTLKIGDSISKENNTGNFNVYRKNQLGKYKFYKNYKIAQ
jgi:hypothetical protein